MRLSLPAALLALTVAFGASASDTVPERLVASAWTVSAGSLYTRDSYLSPLPYTGTGIELGYERTQAMRLSPERWLGQLRLDVAVGETYNAARSASMMRLDLLPAVAVMRRWQVAPSLTLAVGPQIAADLGVLYAMRGGNNPVSARAAVTLGVTGFAARSFSLWGVPAVARYQPSMALVGAFAAPQYGQLYYEVWLGNRRDFFHVAWPGSYLSTDHLVTTDIRLGATALRLGYRWRVMSQAANGNVARTVSHSIAVGLSSEWLTVNPRRQQSGRVISSFY